MPDKGQTVVKADGYVFGNSFIVYDFGSGNFCCQVVGDFFAKSVVVDSHADYITITNGFGNGLHDGFNFWQFGHFNLASSISEVL